MLHHVKRVFDRFRHDEDGGIAIEAILVFPLLTWAYLATFVYFDAFRAQSTALKASYTISDALSREEEYITYDYISSMWYLQRFLTDSSQRTGLRISIVEWNADQNRYLVRWSRNRGGMGNLRNRDMHTIVDQLPVMPDGDIVILVQTRVTYEPAFSVGLEAFNFEDLIVTSMRSSGQLCYSYDGHPDNAKC